MSGAAWLDVVLLLVLAGYLVRGLRWGLIASAFSLGGFLAGAAVAVWALPSLLDRWQGLVEVPLLRAVVVLAGVLLLGSLGQALGGAGGQRVRDRVQLRLARGVDSLLGGVAVLVTACLLLWLLAGAVSGAGIPWAARAVADSVVLRAIERAVPPGAPDAVSGLYRALQSRGFPRVFEGLSVEPVTPVEPAPSDVTAAPGVRAARPSVVRVEGDAPACGDRISGSGWVLAPGRVVTNAHVVAGTDAVAVRAGGRRLAARVVRFDPERDVAVLAVRGLSAPALPRGGELARGDTAAVAGFPLAGPYRVDAARVRERLSARGSDIYGGSGPVRDVYALRVRVRPGNSGGPLLDPDGRVVAVVFAASRDRTDTGYALTLAEVAADLRAGRSASAAVSTGGCTPD